MCIDNLFLRFEMCIDNLFSFVTSTNTVKCLCQLRFEVVLKKIYFVLGTCLSSMVQHGV